MTSQAQAAGADMAGRLSQACAQLGLPVDAQAVDKLLGYLAQMQRWNRTYNLTAIRDPQQMLIQHLFDSLSVGAAERRAGRGACQDL